MKTIGLVTYYNSDNYGAMLQAYALKSEIERNSCRCIVISHDRFSTITKELAREPRGKLGKIKKFASMSLFQPRSMLIAAGSQQKQIKRGKQRTRIKCASFREESFKDRTEVFYYTTEQIMKDPPLCDGYVCGSDQIWNPERFTGAEPFYLDFAPEGRNRISYAPSLAMTSIPDSMKARYTELIAKFSDVSVREKKGCEAIEDATGISPEWVLDPTFLMSKAEWDDFSDVTLDVPERYIFCYFLGKENLLYARPSINEVARKLDCKAVVLPFGEHCADGRWIGSKEVGPREFVGLIKKAEYVLTDSFHGTSLSILLQKNFNVYSGKQTATFANRFDRIANILDICGLTNRSFTGIRDLNLADINYEDVSKSLYPITVKSKHYLEQALNKVEVHKETRKTPPILASYEACTGCSSCYAACQCQAIKMHEDAAGFWRPVIDEERCIHCGRCEEKCPVKTPYRRNSNQPEYYALFAADKAIREKGSSGNAFGVFADIILCGGGEVFGASLSDDCRHLKFHSASDVGLEKLQKSKYFEAEMGNVILQIKAELEAGRKVMFTGTPCQAAGIRSYFGTHPNLLICDFICHGVSSAEWYRRYLNELEMQYNGKAVDVAFRSKAMGWRLYCLRVKFDNGKEYLKTRYADPYYIDFFQNKHLRTNCYSCNRVINSCADITIGDYWAVNVKKNMQDTDEGISVVCARTEQGRNFISEILENRDEVFAQPLNEDDVDETLVSRVRKVPRDNDILPDEFPMNPKLGKKDLMRKIYYEYYVRRIKLRR